RAWRGRATHVFQHMGSGAGSGFEFSVKLAHFGTTKKAAGLAGCGAGCSLTGAVVKGCDSGAFTGTGLLRRESLPLARHAAALRSDFFKPPRRPSAAAASFMSM